MVRIKFKLKNERLVQRLERNERQRLVHRLEGIERQEPGWRFPHEKTKNTFENHVFEIGQKPLIFNVNFTYRKRKHHRFCRFEIRYFFHEKFKPMRPPGTIGPPVGKKRNIMTDGLRLRKRRRNANDGKD